MLLLLLSICQLPLLLYSLPSFLSFFVSRCYAPLVAVPAEAEDGRGRDRRSERWPRATLPPAPGGRGGGGGGELVYKQSKGEASARDG